MNFLHTPFPRPRRNLKNVLLLLSIGLVCSLFILYFQPFDIENQTGEWYVYIIIFSLGVVFFISIFLMEFVIPLLLPKSFINWSLGKAILWYTLVILVVAAIMFLYKSYLDGFRDFTWEEYFFVLGRVLGIGITSTFFTLGIISYVNRRRLSLLSSNEYYLLTATNSKPLKLNINEVMYIVSDDNYVDIHLEISGSRKREVFRSSLKNIESQIVNPLSPIYRCHRKYLINSKYFKIQKMNSRIMIILLDTYHDKIPVSKKYAEQMKKILQIHP